MKPKTPPVSLGPLPREARSKTTHIVIHRCENTAAAAYEYHFLVRRGGLVSRCLPIEAKGAHAFLANAYSIGIAVEGCFCSAIKAKHNLVTPVQLNSLVSLVSHLQLEYLIPTSQVVRHFDLGKLGTTYPEKLIFNQSCPGDLFPWVQFHERLLGEKRARQEAARKAYSEQAESPKPLLPTAHLRLLPGRVPLKRDLD